MEKVDQDANNDHQDAYTNNPFSCFTIHVANIKQSESRSLTLTCPLTVPRARPNRTFKPTKVSWQSESKNFQLGGKDLGRRFFLMDKKFLINILMQTR